MGIEHSEIWETERFGGATKDSEVFCFCCGLVLEEKEVLSDRFGRCFCGIRCKKIFYEGEGL